MRQAIVFVTSVSERDKDNEAVIQDLTQKIVTEGCTHIYDRDGVTVENVEEGTAS